MTDETWDTLTKRLQRVATRAEQSNTRLRAIMIGGAAGELILKNLAISIAATERALAEAAVIAAEQEEEERRLREERDQRDQEAQDLEDYYDD